MFAAFRVLTNPDGQQLEYILAPIFTININANRPSAGFAAGNCMVQASWRDARRLHGSLRRSGQAKRAAFIL
jgi:hypothetical protein